MELFQKLAAYYVTLKSMAQIGQALTDLARMWGGGELSDDHYQALSVDLHLRQRERRDHDTVKARMPAIAEAAKAEGRASYFPKKKPYKKCPDRDASLARRESLASSNPLPSRIHRQFKDAGRAVLKIIGDECKRKGRCMMTLGEIAARAGCCLTTARDTIRDAAYLGYVAIQERRRSKKPNLANIVKIIISEWRDWIASPRYFLSLMLAGSNLTGGASNHLGATAKNRLEIGGNLATLGYKSHQKPSG